MARAVVFVGPSLADTRPFVEGLHYSAPARRGDIGAAVATGISIIGLVDGVFWQSLAVTPREIREAVRAGATVIGAASMGALRACDCPEAMEGVGAIYEAFRDGTLDGEDEVAETFEEATFRLIAYPMVQIRAAVALGMRRGVLRRGLAQTILGRAAGASFDQRTLPFLCRIAGASGPDLGALLADPAADVKRVDAVALVERIGRLLELPTSRPALR